VVRRDGATGSVPADELVPGDVVLLEAGSRVPADGRLVTAHDVEVDESSLTGESQPVAKSTEALIGDLPLAERANVLHANTVVTRGRAEMVTVATGMGTEIGRVAQLLSSAPAPATPLQVQLDSVGRRLALVGIAAVTTYSAVALARGETFEDILLRGVALAVAAVPEGLPAVLALVLALGVHRMAQGGAIVRRLASVETLGSASVVCTDKTGTLTRNEMTVRELATGQPGRVAPAAGDARRLLDAFVLCNDANLTDAGPVGDPMEVALLVAATEHHLSPLEVRAEAPRIGEVPFDAARKFMATLHRTPDGATLMVKGAPDVLLPRCDAVLIDGDEVPLDGPRRDAARAAVEEMAGRGLRVLAAAERRLPAAPRADDELATLTHDLVFLGLAGIADPPRAEAPEAVARCRQAGIDVKMITGDHVATAAAIAHEVGIRGRAVTGAQLDEMTDAELADAVDGIGVFARVAPEHKVAIVEALTRSGQVVAMTGDGVNDAAALRAAHVGVAMGRTGTEVTKDAADVVLTDDNFATIVRAVEQGRGIYDNVVKFIRFQLTTNIAAITAFIAALLLGLPAPMTAVQVLWVNLITDGPPAMALGLDRTSRRVMDRPPRPPSDRILSTRRLLQMLSIGLVMAAGTLAVLGVADTWVGEDRARTLAFTTFVLFQLVNAVNVRAEAESVFSRDLPPNRWLALSLAAVLLMQVLVVYLPPLQELFGTVALRPLDWAVAALVAALALLAGELGKARRRHRGVMDGRAVRPSDPLTNGSPKEEGP